MFRRSFFVWLAVFFLYSVTGRAATFVVTNNADDGSPGTLRATIAAANSNDTITFSTNLSGQTITLKYTTVAVSNSLTIDASSLASGLTITISNQYQANLFIINSNIVVTLNGLTLLGPYVAVNNYVLGGAIYNGGNLTVSNCTFAYNGVGDNGGAIYNAGTLAVNRSSFIGNSAFDPFAGNSWDSHTGNGGAIYNVGSLAVNQSTFTNNSTFYGSGGCIFNSGILMVDRSTFLNNNAYPYAGGAIYNNSNMVVNQSTFIGNFAGDGGAIFNSFFGVATVNQSTIIGAPQYFDDNIDAYFNAYNGGGIENNYGVLTVNQSTFTGNSAVSDGGGIENFAGTLSVNQSTITGNAAYESGGGIDSETDNNGEGGSVTLFNSIVAGDTITPGSDSDISGGVSTNNGVNLTNGMPLLAPIGNYGGPTPTMPPLPGATNIIDAGSDEAINCFTTDQRGLPRLSGTHVDIGAAELQQGTVTTLGVSQAAATGATLNGNVTLNDPALIWYFQTGSNGSSWFQYGTTTGYGTLSPATNSGLVYALSANSNNVTVSQQVIGLSAGTTYHYLLLANGVSADSGGDVAFTTLNFVAGTTPTLAGVMMSGGGFQLAFTNVANASFTVYSSTNMVLPFTQWTRIGAATEFPAGSGQYQFIDPLVGTGAQKFYRVCSP